MVDMEKPGCFRIVGVVFYILITFSALTQNRIVLHNRFEGGNGRLVSQDYSQNTVAVRPELKNGDRIECWFFFQLTGFRTDTILTVNLPFVNHHHTPDPLLVKENGEWKRTGAVNFGFYKQYQIQPQSDTITIATGIPYTYSQLLVKLESLKEYPICSISTLIASEKGRNIPLVTITNPNIVDKKGSVLITARQHAFESPASHFMEGLLNFLVGDSEEAAILRDNYMIFVVPMVDVDQVAEGGTGKDQFPVDFNRDWTNKAHWTAVKAIQKLAGEIDSQWPLTFFLDIHSPFPISTISSHYYVSYTEGSEKFIKLRNFFQSYSQREGFDLPMVRNYSVTPGQRTIRNYMDNEDWQKDQTPHFRQLLIATTYEQSWQTKPDGTVYTIPQIYESARNMGTTLGQFLKNRQ
jgi:hypothetical protein